MAKNIKNPKQLLKVLWDQDFENIYVGRSGDWSKDADQVKDIVRTFNVSEIEGSSKLDALYALYRFNKWYRYETDAETRKDFDKENEFNREVHEQNERALRKHMEEKGVEFVPTPFVDFKDMFSTLDYLFTDLLIMEGVSEEYPRIDGYFEGLGEELGRIFESEMGLPPGKTAKDYGYDFGFLGDSFFVYELVEREEYAAEQKAHEEKYGEEAFLYDEPEQYYRVYLQEGDELIERIKDDIGELCDRVTKDVNRHLTKQIKSWLYNDFKIRF